MSLCLRSYQVTQIYRYFQMLHSPLYQDILGSTITPKCSVLSFLQDKLWSSQNEHIMHAYCFNPASAIQQGAELASYTKLKWILICSKRKPWELKWICILKLQLKMCAWKKYGWKLAAKRVNTDWDNGTKPLLILYFEHVPFAQSILHLFCCSKEEQNKIPLRCHFVSQYQLKWRIMIWSKPPILFD